MSDIIRRVIPEHPVSGKRTGRHVEHDPRSRAFPYEAAAGLQSLRRKRGAGAFNQGDLGSCTGNASVGATASAPFRNPLRARCNSQKAPLTVYSAATKLDEFDGAYPPDDTGSSGLAVAKALQQMGIVSTYQHAFSLGAAVSALANPGVGAIFGIDWYDSFDEPDSRGLVAISPNAQIRGGHEIEALGVELANPGTYGASDLAWFMQSWGHWGLNGSGLFAMSLGTLAVLLEHQGDCTVLLPPSA